VSARGLGLVGQVARHAVLLAGAGIMLAPFVWMISLSLKPQGEILTAEIHLLPKQWAAWQNYAAAFTETRLLRFLINGVVVTATIFALQLVITLPCAYALAKLRFRGRELLFSLVLLSLLVPLHATSIPIYILFHFMGVLDGYTALVLPFTISVFGIFMMRQFFMTVPGELIDAALLDGLSEIAIVWRIMLPTAIPAVVAFGIFSVVAHWNDYFWPLVVVNTADFYTPPLGIAHFRTSEGGTSYGPLMAAATVVIAPLVAAFLVAQRRFIEGITFTGLKN
jgi:multiple sugar transport system permease protein